jgi:hypothetical protein
MFPQPWTSEWCGDCYRVFDATGRQLFVITGDEHNEEDEAPTESTVLQYGTPDEIYELGQQIEALFPEGSA